MRDQRSRTRRAFERAVESAMLSIAWRGQHGNYPGATWYVANGQPIPERFLPGRAIMSLRPEEREDLAALTSDMTSKYRLPEWRGKRFV